MEGGGHSHLLKEDSVKGGWHSLGKCLRPECLEAHSPQSSGLARHTLSEVKSGLVPRIQPPSLHSSI